MSGEILVLDDKFIFSSLWSVDFYSDDYKIKNKEMVVTDMW